MLDQRIIVVFSASVPFMYVERSRKEGERMLVEGPDAIRRRRIEQARKTVAANRGTDEPPIRIKPRQLELSLQARTQGGGGGGSPLPMNPLGSFKFRFKINGMLAHCVRARFRDRSRS